MEKEQLRATETQLVNLMAAGHSWQEAAHYGSFSHQKWDERRSHYGILRRLISKLWGDIEEVSLLE